MFGEYKILDWNAGRGGSKKVIKAHDTELGIDIAIKVVELDRDVGRLSRSSLTQRNLFEREIQTLAKLTHPNIVRVYKTTEIDGNPAIVEEWIDGGTLEDLIGKIDEKRVIDIGIECSSGILYAQEKLSEKTNSFIHGDIKPDNIYLTKKGQVKVGDFGLGGSDNEIPPGSVVYLSPEQINKLKGEKVETDPRHDTFSLGVTLFRLVTKRFPHIDINFLQNTSSLDSLEFYGETLNHILCRDWNPNINSVNSDISRNVNNLVRDMLSLDIENRPYIREVLGRLEDIKNAPERKKRFVRGLISIGGALLFSGLITYQSLKPTPPIPLDDRILVVSKQDGDAEIYSDREGVLTKLTDNEVDDQKIVSHPYGRRFVFERGNRITGGRDIVEMDVNGEGKRVIASNNVYDEFGFSYDEEGDEGIYLMRYGPVQTQVIVVERGEDGEWQSRPSSFTGDNISKTRLFIENTALILREDRLEIISTNPNTTNSTLIAEGCQDFEVRDNEIFYITNGAIYVKQFAQGEAEGNLGPEYARFGFNSDARTILETVPKDAIITSNQDRSIISVKRKSFVEGDDFEKIIYVKRDINQNLILNNLTTITNPNNLEKSVVVLSQGDSQRTLGLTHVLEAVRCVVIDEKIKREDNQNNQQKEVIETNSKLVHILEDLVLVDEDLGGTLDNEYVYFPRNGDPYRVNIQSGRLERLVSTERREIEIVRGRDRLLLTTREDNGVYAMDDRGRIEKLREGVYSQLQTNRLGNTFLTSYDKNNLKLGILLGEDNEQKGIIEISPRSTNDTVLLNPYKSRILYRGYEIRNKRAIPIGLAIYDFDTGEQTLVTKDKNLKFCWSNDGESVYYTSLMSPTIGMYTNGEDSKINIFTQLRELDIELGNVKQIFGSEDKVYLIVEEGTTVIGEEEKNTNSLVIYDLIKHELTFEGEIERNLIILGAR